MVPVDAALHQGVVSLSTAVALWRGDSRTRTDVRACLDPAAESPAETVARLALIRSGLIPRSQVEYDGIGRADLQVEHVVVEADGRDYHSDPAAFTRDRSKDRRLRRLGLTVLRYAASEVFADPDQVARDVHELLATPPGAVA